MRAMPRPEFTCAVQVQPLPEQSDEKAGVHAYAYTITIQNTGDVTAQLIGRHWVITDGEGKVEEVRGLAVVGHQPLLKPGESFEYTSWTRLETPQGTMRGTYFCMTEDAHPFEAQVPEFMLAARAALH
jgi:ApaG protein